MDVQIEKKGVSSGDFKTGSKPAGNQGDTSKQPTYLLGYYIPSLREVLPRLGLVTQYPILVQVRYWYWYEF